MSELKECPFCGDCGSVIENVVYQDSVFCENCGTQQRINTWQSRPIEDALNARITELEAALKDAHELLNMALEVGGNDVDNQDTE